MGRLTERDGFGNTDIIGVDSMDLQCNLEFDEFNKVTNALNKLAEYEELEEQNRLLKLPCAVGDTVWYWDKEYDPIEEAPFEGYISGYEIVSAKTIYIIINPKSNFKSWFPCDVKLEIDDFGKTVFLTREEAEAALKELEGEE